MVMDYGMSERLGLVKLGTAETEPFGAQGGGNSHETSDAITAVIDEEVRALLDHAAREAWQILSRNRSVLDNLAQRLLDEETLTENELEEIFKDVIKQEERPVWNYQSDAAVEGAKWGDPVGISDSSTKPQTPQQASPQERPGE